MPCVHAPNALGDSPSYQTLLQSLLKLMSSLRGLAALRSQRLLCQIRQWLRLHTLPFCHFGWLLGCYKH
jgi:hypothetical protein